MHARPSRAGDIGSVDHEPLPYPTPPAFATFFDPAYHGVVSYLHDRLAGIVGARAPQLAGHVWLSEANSVCHQGTFNVTNAFANSLWLLDRLGLMATAGVQLMARQSLIGCVCVLHCCRVRPPNTTTTASTVLRTRTRMHARARTVTIFVLLPVVFVCDSCCDVAVVVAAVVVVVVALPLQIQLLAPRKLPRRAADAVA